MEPMNIACQGSTVAHPAVIETRPARMPLQTMPTSYVFEKMRSKKTTVMPPTAAERVVHIAARAIMGPYPAGVMPRVEPWRRQKR